MTDYASNVKENAGRIRRVMSWIDSHPRTGWYIAVVVTLDLLVTLFQAFS